MFNFQLWTVQFINFTIFDLRTAANGAGTPTSMK